MVSIAKKAIQATAITGAIVASSFIISGNVYATNSHSTTANITVPVSTIVHADEGSTTEVARTSVEDAHVGMVCSVKANSENQSSVHPGNDLVVRSGNSSITLEDVEREAGVTTHANGELTLGNDIVVSLVMGSDGAFSAGMDLQVSCEEREIEVCRDGMIKSIKPSERKESDTDAPCDIEVCRDGKVVTINSEEDRKSTDTNAPCEEEKVTVCRDDKIMEVNKNDVKDSDVVGTKCPGEVLPEKTLPNTGAGSTGLIIAAVLGAGVVGQVVVSRRQRSF